MPSRPDMDIVGLDEERKKELVMEKRLRACRVNIIPRDRGYFTEPDIPPPVSKRQKTPPPSPASVQRAKNPVALRYWNQCMDKTAPKEINDITEPQNKESPMMKRHQNNQKVDTVLSSAGTGIKRENEVKEALGNINRFFTIDKVKKDDAERVSRTRNRPEKIEVRINDANCKPYNLIKEEQIKISQERSNFQSRSTNRIPNSPKPFRRGVSETRVSNPERSCSCNHEINKRELNMNQMLNEVIPNMNQNQKAHLGIALFDQLPGDIVDALLSQQLSSMPKMRLQSVMNSLPDETVSMAVPALFPRTKDDVKLSLILDSVPKLTKQLRK
eukprot:TRINITY_DN19954_c0_g1_i4.p1 TRINITY_DN19954_c0_g1~~TRINITY_DN19954_c0_g1_i4.p1  ORF type:complete len:329 (+),score=75.25 TRINITY_DN19954_c0_g1_i4:56-1042(+)